MIKMVFCVKKRADISGEEFTEYWLNRHAPLVESHRQSLRMTKYAQRHNALNALQELAIEARGMSPGYDGFAEVWWEDEETLQAALSSEAGLAASAILAEDEAKFIDLSKSTISFTQEHTIFE